MHEIQKITEEDDQLIYENLMKEFKAPDGYIKKNYYGVASMRLKKNGDWNIRLQYDYSKSHAVNSEAISFDNVADYITALMVLENRATTVQVKKINLRQKTQEIEQDEEKPLDF